MAETSLWRNVGFTVATQGANITAALVTTPVILSGLGLRAFGVWTVALAVASYITTLGGGMGASLQRFAAVAAARDDPGGMRKLFWTGIAGFSAIGLLIALLIQPLAPALVSAFDVGGALESDAEGMWRLMGISIGLALLASFLGNMQHGLGRFARFARDQSLALIVYTGAVVAAVQLQGGLRGVAIASLTYHALLIVLRTVSLHDIARPLHAPLLSWSVVREVGKFSAFMQVTMMGNLVNLQSDRIVAGAVAAPAVVGQLGIGSQVAAALRLLAGSASSPVLTRLSMTHGSGASDQLEDEFRGINRTWALTAIGCAGILTASLVPLLDAWVGPGHEEAAGFAAILIFAYTVNVLATPATSLLNAKGRPDIEAKYTILTAVLNVGASIGLGLAFGVTGVVMATAFAYVLGTAWFLLKLRQFARWVPENPGRLAMRVLTCLLPSAGAAFGWCWLVQELVPSGIGVVPAGIGMGACTFLYLRFVNVIPQLAQILRQRAAAR